VASVESTQAHEIRELAPATCVRRAAADICALRRSAPTWSPIPVYDEAASHAPVAHPVTHENGSGAIQLLRAADRRSGDRVSNCFARRAVGRTVPPGGAWH